MIRNYPGVGIFMNCVLTVLCIVLTGSAQTQLSAPVTFVAGDRILVLAPHPDDEVLGCAGIMQEAVKQKLPVRVVFFTYGDDNERSFLVYRKHPVWEPAAVRRMGMVRHEEAVAAARIIGLEPDQLRFLGYPDGGGLEIWQRHWNQEPAYLSHLTKASSVPYTNALRPGSPYKGEAIVRDLATIVTEFRPTKIFVAHPGDHHPDHQSLPLFLQVALWDLKLEPQPRLYPYLVHHKHWPTPFGFHPQAPLPPPPGWPALPGWHPYALDQDRLATKEKALKAHRTQYDYSGIWLLSFVRQNELFGVTPEVKLAPDTPSLSLGSNAPAHAVTPPEHLRAEERESYVGLVHHAIALRAGELVMTIHCTRPLPERAQLSIYAFGYRGDQPFAAMPKLHVVVQRERHLVWDQSRPLSAAAVTVDRQGTQFTLKIPLAMLKQPEKIFMSAQTHAEDVHLDSLPWRIIDLEDNR